MSSTGEKRVIKGLEHIFHDVFLVSCTEVIESFGVFEGLTSLGIEVGRNAYD
jgi:hypothetical protein